MKGNWNFLFAKPNHACEIGGGKRKKKYISAFFTSEIDVVKDADLNMDPDLKRLGINKMNIASIFKISYFLPLQDQNEESKINIYSEREKSSKETKVES